MVSSSSTTPLSPPPRSPHMCKSRKDTLASDPIPRSPTTTTPRRPSSSSYTTSTSTPAPPPQFPSTTTASSTSFSSSSSSLATLRLSLSQNPILYPLPELSSATNNFLSKQLSPSSSSSSSSSWRCTLRGADAIVFQLSFRGADPSDLPSRLSSLCKSHHRSLAKLLGATLAGDHLYLVYDYVPGASLLDCLRNPRNPNFTPLSKWISRMQVATDLADGLSYIHHDCGTIHNRVKSSSVIVTEPTFNAKICHFGAAALSGEIPDDVVVDEKTREEDEDEEEDEISMETAPPAAAASPRVWRRSDSRRMRIQGARGYIAPEVIAGGRISHKSDVFAFGVVILELVSGREPLKYTMNRQTNNYERVSLIEAARDAIGTEDEDEASEAEERRGRIRQWVDRRLRDSFPVDAAEKLIRVALRCVEEAAFMRPDMRWVAGKVSKLFLDSQAWQERVSFPTDFSVSLAPR